MIGQRLKIYAGHKNITCKDIEPIYYQDKDLYLKSMVLQLSIYKVIYIVSDVLSQLTNSGNQNTIHN